MTKDTLRIALVGAGHRGLIYSRYAVKQTDKVRMVAVADPNSYRREQAAKEFGIPPECVFSTAEELAESGMELDLVINGTMDKQHVPTTLPLLEKGWNVLLEKPICTNSEDLYALNEAAKKNNSKVMVCHVLRYAPFYVAVKKLLLAGEIGDIISINTEENVSYHHIAVGYLRGRWRNEKECGSPILMAKCCHDLDLITWFMSGIAPVKTASFGSLMHFREDKAPEGSGTRCLVDCKIEKQCPYSAYNNYIEKGLWGTYAWESVEHYGKDLNDEIKIQSLKTDNPFGRCVWRCDNDVYDHQSVIIEFENGATATHNLLSPASKACRTIHIVGTKGEIAGDMHDGYLVVRKPDLEKGREFSETKIEVNVSGDGHGGGDARLTDDFIRVMSGEQPSVSTTTLNDSLYGHLIGFMADESVKTGQVKKIVKL